MDRAQNDTVWLVKSGERVLGPFKTDEVTERILAKDVVAIDEVASPMSRWRYVRDEPAFASAVEQIRSGLVNSREDTEVQGFTATSTPTESLLGAIGRYRQETVTLATEVTQQPKGAAQPSVVDADFIEVSPRPAARRNDASEVDEVRKYTYGSEGNGAAPSGSKRPVVLWAIAVVLFVGVAGLFLRKAGLGGASMNVSEGGQFEELRQKAERSYALGDFETAIGLYTRADLAKPGQAEVVFRRALLMIAKEGQTVAGKRALLELIERNDTTGIRANIYVALGLAELINEDYDAAKQRFAGALNESPDHSAALFNKGVALYLAKSFDSAIESFRRMIGREDQPAARLMLARAMAARGTPADFASAGEAVEPVLAGSADLRQEALILGAFYDLQAGNRRRAMARVREAVDADPYLTAEHFHDPLYAMMALDWRSLLPMCEQLRDKLKTPLTRALHGVCIAKAGRANEGQSELSETSFNEVESASLIHSANAYVLLLLGRDEDARGALRLATRGDSTRIAQILIGRECDGRGDRECALTSWQSLETLRPPELVALVKLGEVAFGAGETREARRLTERALARSPRYLPALRLNERLQGAVKK